MQVGYASTPPPFFLFDIVFLLFSFFNVDVQPAFQLRSWTFDELGSYQVWILARGDWMKSVVSGWFRAIPTWRDIRVTQSWYRSLLCSLSSLLWIDRFACRSCLATDLGVYNVVLPVSSLVRLVLLSLFRPIHALGIDDERQQQKS
jgi:hypothetical protein